jgi:hypothetical protein
MSLQEASDARKDRLSALRRRKEGGTTDENGYVAIEPCVLGLITPIITVVPYC